MDSRNVSTADDRLLAANSSIASRFDSHASDVRRSVIGSNAAPSSLNAQAIFLIGPRRPEPSDLEARLEQRTL